MSINSIQIRNFMGMFEENTIIGGVSSVLNTPYKLAQKLGVSVSRIEGFRIVGDDIEFRIKGSYNLVVGAFGNSSAAGVTVPSITKYIDNGGLLLTPTGYTFSHLDNFEEFIGLETTSIQRNFINVPKLRKLTVPKYIGETSTSAWGVLDGATNPDLKIDFSGVTHLNGYYTFRNTQMKEINLPSLVEIKSTREGDNFYFFYNMSKTEVFRARNLRTLGNNVALGYFDLLGKNCLFEVNKALDKSVTGVDNLILVKILCLCDAKVDFYENDVYFNTLTLQDNFEIGMVSPFSTKQDLRNVLGVYSWIGNFTKGVNKVEFNLYKEQNFVSNFQNNTNVTSFIDKEGILVGSNINSFSNVFNGSSNFETLYLPNIKFIGSNIIKGTKVKTLELLNVENIGTQTFTQCPLLEYISLPKLSNVPLNYSLLFAYNPNLKEVNAPLINNLPNSSYYSNPLLERALHDYVESLGTYVFYRNYAIKEISLKRAKVLGTGLQTDQIFTDIGQRCSIKINIATDSTNNGSTDGNLMYAWLERDAVVEFYDDNLEYVKTLSRPTNFTIKGIGTQFPDKVSFRDYVGTNRNMRFGSYTVTDNDVSFYLDSAVKLSSTFDGNENITEFISTSGKLTQATWEDLNSTFKNAINLRVYDVPETTNVGVDVFLNTKIEVLDLPNVINIQSASFSSMYLVKTINLPILTTLNNGNTRSFYDCPLLEEVNAPKITFMTDSFYYNCIGLKRAIHNEVTNMIGVGRQFYNCQSIERIELKKCKGIGTENTNSNVFYNIKLGCEIHIHIYNKTSNNGGLNVNLEYAKTQRNAIISFYDDNGTLIETI